MTLDVVLPLAITMGSTTVMCVSHRYLALAQTQRQDTMILLIVAAVMRAKTVVQAAIVHVKTTAKTMLDQQTKLLRNQNSNMMQHSLRLYSLQNSSHLRYHRKYHLGEFQYYLKNDIFSIKITI